MRNGLKFVTLAFAVMIVTSCISIITVSANKDTVINIPKGTIITVSKDTDTAGSSYTVSRDSEVTVSNTKKYRSVPIVVSIVAVIAAGAYIFIKKSDDTTVQLKKGIKSNKIKYSEKDIKTVMLIKELADIFKAVDETYKD